MQEGRIIKAYGGFYYVQTETDVITCFLRKRIKREMNVLIGDEVKIRMADEEKGVIEAILPRRNELLRPPVANVDQMVIVFAASEPEPNFMLLDRFLFLGEKAGLHIIICFNKMDLVDIPDFQAKTALYHEIGYPVQYLSAKKELGIDAFKDGLSQKISVFCGPSGVGKSALLNAIQPGMQLKTGEISDKIKRGKHTTRHVELLPFKQGGYIVDTPGFSYLTFEDVKPEQVIDYFPDLKPYQKDCQYRECLHRQQTGCGVYEALLAGNISKERYERYLEFLTEISGEEK